MTNISCSFKGHTYRRHICQKAATSFLRAAKGTIWPLCDNCSTRHRKVSGDMVRKGQMVLNQAAQASFNIPIDDPRTRAEFKAQDPGLIRAMIRTADAMTSGRTDGVIN